jgi:hypothetical protein
MGLAASPLVFFSGAPQANDGSTDPAQKSSSPSPEEGRSLLKAFLRIERADLRQEIFRFVTEMSKIQDRGRQQTH